MRPKTDRSLPVDDIWAGYFKKRRYWFLACVPVLLLLLGVNVLKTAAAALMAVAAVTLAVIAILVIAMRQRIRRTARRLTSSEHPFFTEAILLRDAIVGTGEPWATLQATGRATLLGTAGVLSLDGEGLHWTSSIHRPQVRIDLHPIDVQRCELRKLGWWMSGLGVWTNNGERLAILLPGVDRPSAERSVAALRTAAASG